MPEHTAIARPRYTLDVDEYLIGSTAFSVFLWQVLYTGALNFFLGYIVVLGNSLFLLTRGELVIHRSFILVLLAITSTSAIAAVITHNPVHGTIAEMAGISVFLVYHFSVFHRTRFSLQHVMEVYIRCAAFTAIWGYPLWLFHKARGETFYRFCSWFAEPSHYVYATLPAVCYILFELHRDKKLNYWNVPLLFSYVLADSSTGYIGIGIAIFLMADLRSFRRILISGATVIAAACLVYSLSGNVQMRVDDTVNSEIKSETRNAVAQKLQENDPSFGSNATTFALLSNAYVAWRAFLASPIIGNGLGNHSAIYDRYVPDIVSPHFFLYGLNRDDANSLILRLMSETGIVGLFFVSFLLVYFGRVRGSPYTLIHKAIIPYFVMRLIRFGAYFSLENFFFMMIYAFNYLQYRAADRVSGNYRE